MKKDLVAICVVIFLIVLLCMGTKIQTVEDYYLTHIDDITPESQTVYLTIRCDTILQNWDKLDTALKDEKYVPQNGVILSKTEYVLRPKDSAFDVFARGVKYNKIQMEFEQNEVLNSVYVKGLNHIYERSCGDLSGWVFVVNGVIWSDSAGKYAPKHKDSIGWYYTCAMGKDLTPFLEVA